MKVNEIIADVRNTCRGIALDDDQLIKMLRELEGRLYSSIYESYEDAPVYTPVEDCSSSLLIPEEYADVYRYWLSSKIYLSVGDYDRYNTFASLYATALDAFKCFYIRNHMPKRVNIRY
ncbi:MAG: hypothetical protein IJD22_03140 [Clostridia bacterium]|nr:hypothetical protein [Clostridia bacterium]